MEEPARLAIAPGEAASVPWKNALAALDPLLREQARGTRVHVTLSNSLVRYALVPGRSKLGGHADDAYVRDCFGQLYGEAASGWAFCTARAPGAVRVASAVDAELVGELAAACASAGLALSSLRPLLSGVVNRWRGEMRERCFWLVIAEAGTLCLAFAQRRRWRALRVVRTGDGWLDSLAALLEREALLSGIQADAAMVFLWGPDLPDGIHRDAGNWPVKRLCAVAPDGMSLSTATWLGACL